MTTFYQQKSKISITPKQVGLFILALILIILMAKSSVTIESAIKYLTS